jgi:hypothetical protein
MTPDRIFTGMGLADGSPRTLPFIFGTGNPVRAINRYLTMMPHVNAVLSPSLTPHVTTVISLPAPAGYPVAIDELTAHLPCLTVQLPPVTS